MFVKFNSMAGDNGMYDIQQNLMPLLLSTVFVRVFEHGLLDKYFVFFSSQLLYHDVSSGIAYSYSVPHHLDQNANMDKQNEEHGAPSPRDDIASREQLEQTHARSALRDSKIHVSEIPDDMDSPATTVRPTPYHHHTVGGPDRHSDGRRRRPIFSSDFKRPRYSADC